MVNWTKQQREWLIEQLAKFGLEQVDELIDYLLQCEDDAILKEYLSGLLGGGEETEKFFQELFGNTNYAAKSEESDAFPSRNNIPFKHDRKAKKSGKKSNFSSKSAPSTEKDANSSTLFIRNCLCCGKVVMEQASCCVFCGWSPGEDADKFGKTLWGETFREAIVRNSRSKRSRSRVENRNNLYEDSEYSKESSDSEDLDEIDYEILSKKERLLELERNPTERLIVFDENVDYFDMSCYSQMDEEQKKKLEEKKMEQLRIAKEMEESVTTTFDIEGKLVYQGNRNPRPYFNPLLPGPSPIFIARSRNGQSKQD